MYLECRLNHAGKLRAAEIISKNSKRSRQMSLKLILNNGL